MGTASTALFLPVWLQAIDFAAFPVNAHANAVHNPRALYRFPTTAAKVAAAAPVAAPISLLDSSTVADGAAAIIIASGNIASELAGPMIGSQGRRLRPQRWRLAHVLNRYGSTPLPRRPQVHSNRQKSDVPKSMSQTSAISMASSRRSPSKPLVSRGVATRRAGPPREISPWEAHYHSRRAVAVRRGAIVSEHWASINWSSLPHNSVGRQVVPR